MLCARLRQVWDGVESGRCLRVFACHSGAVRDARWSACGRHLLSGSFDNKAAITDVETGEEHHLHLEE
ncbi:WD repeat-containing protein 25 [Liparis tanakae]|uniref:WD repeat-containing protein 25 n=1 Tax=Liparis tanakae TaxID=230148 RepID=A0A4Z2FKP6_9TELE|nr:WD repeat-containing protein 25 [Liparis tanakae]